MKGARISVLDYGSGNLTSVCRALLHLGAIPQVVSDRSDFVVSNPLIIPGVGAFPSAMDAIERGGFRPLITESVKAGTPVLGICLGLQILFEIGYEFVPTRGLGLIAGEVRKIPDLADKNHAAKRTHVGWKPLRVSVWGENSELFRGVGSKDHFYFVHSFAVFPAEPAAVLATHLCHGHEIVSVARKENVLGVQFHPEKSGRSGLKFLANFLRQ